MKWLLGLILLTFFSPLYAQAGRQGLSLYCNDLVGLRLGRARVVSTEIVHKGSLPDDLKSIVPQTKIRTNFCRVKIFDKPSSDSAIKSEIWLPTDQWTGRYLGTGNSGFGGSLAYEQMERGIAQGDVVSGTDAGHQDFDPSFAYGHKEKVKDFGWRAIHDTALEARAITRIFYGKAARYSYFIGCSDGGREGLMEAERFPSDYDGILAGDPPADWTGLLASGGVDAKALDRNENAYIPNTALPWIASSIRSECDDMDGLGDGVLNDPRNCHLDLVQLGCTSTRQTDCLTAQQLTSLRTLYGSKYDNTGREEYPGRSLGGEDADGGWGGWLLGGKFKDSTALLFYVQGFFRYFVYDDPSWTVSASLFTKDLAMARATSGNDLDADDPDLTRYVSRGGKLIIYQGWSDPAVPPLATIKFYEAITSRTRKANKGVRLFMVPGMLHCGGGPGVSDFGQAGVGLVGDPQHDAITALRVWVESALPPDQFIAHSEGKSRPVCAYPLGLQYIGGDPKTAESFQCVADH